ncbi:MAG: hypothetical protein ACT4O2_13910 [Beijerinckiaceae bacterium]
MTAHGLSVSFTVDACCKAFPVSGLMLEAYAAIIRKTVEARCDDTHVAVPRPPSIGVRFADVEDVVAHV